ncbi:retrotransposon protein, putative, ty1-copia subclass [Tanacetum coccineum]
MVLGIAPMAIIDRQLPFEYTITSRSTDVVVMAQPVQNINHSAFRSMFEREKLSGNNFNNWFRQLKLVLRVEKKMHVIEQPLPAAPAADSEAQFKNSSPYDLIKELKAMFKKQAGVERFDLIQTFYACKQEEGKPVAAYVIQMKGYVDRLERLGYMLPQDLIVGLILNGLTKDFVRFVRNYNMDNMGKMIGELHAMLIEYEKGLPKKAETPQVMMIKGGKIQKAKKKSLKAKGKGKAKDDTCHHCKEVGHWKRNYPVYLDELLKKKKQVGSASSSDNCHYAPSITRGVVSVHRLVENGFVLCFTDFGISVFKNNVFYFNVIPSNGIYEIDMHDLVPNVNSIYNVSTKRAKHNLDSTYLYDESFDQCVSCLSGKMTRIPFPHRLERVTDLLGIIHTDVCGLLRHVSIQGASYFITFTDDYSRYGYVYLLKHKHEVFETFKVFKNEVENQLGKTIKALRSDRGYPKETMGYYFYFPPKNKIVVARYAEFFKKNLITQEVSRRAIDLEEIQDEDTSPSKITSEIPMEVEGFKPPQEEEIPFRRSERSRRVPNRLCLNVEAEEHSLGDLNEPTTYKAAMIDSESNMWIDAINAEIQSMMDNMVWVLVDLPPGCKTVRKTFSPVADIRAIRILISIAAYYDYKIWQIDVKTAFLNGYLDEDIYMVQPEGFVDPNHPRKVCKLQRSIYGLKQASRSWNKRFDEEIKRFGFDQNLDEPCVYQKASGSNVTFLILYVDDIIIMGNHIPSLQSVKDYLGKCFAMKDLGEAAFILGIKIYRDRLKRLIRLGQNAYMDKILKRYKMDNSKRGHIPMQERLDFNKTQGASTPKEVKHMQNVPYASVVGSIMYAVRCTRPDFAFAQNITSWFQQNPGELHWTAMKNILKYLRNTKDMFLVYDGYSEAKLRVECYCDVGFETDRDDTKSQTRYVFILNGGAVDWKSSKQSTTAMSAIEAEYIVASEAAMEAVWIRKFISGLGIVPKINKPIRMFCDNSAALYFANEPGVQKGARHYHRRYHYVHKSIALGKIRFIKVHTDDNLVDPFTMTLSKTKLTQHARSMRLRLASSFM